jgi:hypothetical protein
MPLSSQTLATLWTKLEADPYDRKMLQGQAPGQRLYTTYKPHLSFWDIRHLRAAPPSRTVGSGERQAGARVPAEEE